MTAHGAALPRAGRASDRLDRSTLVVSSVVITGAIMSILDTTIVNVALEALSRDLGATLTTIQWVSTGYLLSLAMVIPLAGWTSERFGAKRVWMTSVALFAVGSALCGLASSAGTLIFFRILQGLGGGLIMPVGMSVLAQRAGPQRMGRVMSVMGIPMLLGPVLGPVLGGLIVSSASWRWIFYVNVPIAVVALVLAARLLPRGVGRGDAGKLDLVGVALLSPGLAGIVFGLSEIESQGGIGSALTLGPILAGALLVGLFARHALVADRPLIDVGLFRDRSFAAAAGLLFLMGAAVFGAMLIIPLYYQEARGQDALAAGLLMAPQGIGAALVMPISGRLVDRIGGGRVVLVGTVVMTLATLPFALLAPGTPTLLLHALLFVRGIGLGCAMMPSMAAAYAELRPAQVPRATGAINAIQRIGGSVGTAALAVVLEHQMQASRGVVEVTSAFAHTFAWAAGITLVAVPAAALLTWFELSDRRLRKGVVPRRAQGPVHPRGR
jgi:EmrB/QacA subfamily drug resistance transporter